MTGRTRPVLLRTPRRGGDAAIGRKLYRYFLQAGIPQPIQYERNLYLAAGVTTAREVGGDFDKSKRWQAESNAHTIIAPRILVYPNLRERLRQVEPARLGDLAASFYAARVSIMLDHHISNPGFGDVQLLDPAAEADGDATLDVLHVALGGDWHEVEVSDAFGQPHVARWLLTPNGSALVEAALDFAAGFLRKSGSTFSTSASAVMPCFLRRIGTLPCSMNSSGQPIRTIGV